MTSGERPSTQQHEDLGMTKNATESFSAQEKAAIKERAAELKRQATRNDGEADVLAKIAEMPEQDNALATHFHELVRDVAPDLVPRTWYSMPAYATPGKKGRVLCFFQGAAKMETRYNSIGFGDTATLDEGSMWATSFAVLEWNASTEKQLSDLMRKAV